MSVNKNLYKKNAEKHVSVFRGFNWIPPNKLKLFFCYFIFFYFLFFTNHDFFLHFKISYTTYYWYCSILFFATVKYGKWRKQMTFISCKSKNKGLRGAKKIPKTTKLNKNCLKTKFLSDLIIKPWTPFLTKC